MIPTTTLEEIFDGIDPENPEFPEDFNPKEIVELDHGRLGYPMNAWIQEFQCDDVPDKLMLDIEHFRNCEVESPLITWIISNGNSYYRIQEMCEPDYSDDEYYDWCVNDYVIPEYLHKYLHIYQGERELYPDISALMCWIIFMEGTIPELLWGEHDVFRSNIRHMRLPLDSNFSLLNPVATWLVYRRRQPIPDTLIHLLPQLMNIDTYTSKCTIIYFIRSNYQFPFPDIVWDEVYNIVHERDSYYQCGLSLLCNWKQYRPDEPVPRVLCKERFLWNRIPLDHFRDTDWAIYKKLRDREPLDDTDVDKLLNMFPEEKWLFFLECCTYIRYHSEL